VIILTLHLH